MKFKEKYNQFISWKHHVNYKFTQPYHIRKIKKNSNKMQKYKKNRKKLFDLKNIHANKQKKTKQ